MSGPVRVQPKLRAFAVVEEGENTGGIVFARHAIVARKIGAPHGAPARVGRLRAYGNAIVAPAAEAFIRAYLDVRTAA